MNTNILMVDEDNACVGHRFLLNKQRYLVDQTDNNETAKEMLSQRDYRTLIIEPYQRRVPLTPYAPRAKIIRDAREKGLIVVVSTSQFPETLLALGLVNGRDYQAYFRKPYDYTDFIDSFNELISALHQHSVSGQ